MRAEDILNLKICSAEFADDLTIKGYLIKLLKALWSEGEDFSGKRPFGNSGWQHDLYKPLILEGCVFGSIDEDGYIIEVDEDASDKLVARLINLL